jgi:CxxC motif-containing protein
MAVTMKDDILETTGHSCPKGMEFAEREWYHPVRILTTTVRTDDDKLRRIPVRTISDIPKDKLMDAMVALDAVVVTLPISIGTVIVQNLLNLGTDVIATFSMQPLSR